MKVALRAHHPCEGDTEGLGKSVVSNQEEKSSCTFQGCGLCPGAFVLTRIFTAIRALFWNVRRTFVI